LAEELAKLIGIDSWLISSMHDVCNDLDFKEEKGLNRLANQVENLLTNLRKKYQEYGIKDEPYCFVKADSGTYGIAVWPVFNAEEILHINKKERNKMNMLKGSVQNTHVMIQEGIKTIDRIEGKIAEPMIYMINGQVVGNLFRANAERDEKISLNATGANFFDLENLNENQVQLGIEKNKITEVYSVIARLAALAASIENQQMLNVK
jgi:glutamate--cysteine ligase